MVETTETCIANRLRSAGCVFAEDEPQMNLYNIQRINACPIMVFNDKIEVA